MVPLLDPDLARFPRFAEAMRNAQSAELEPGDASTFRMAGGITSNR